MDARNRISREYKDKWQMKHYQEVVVVISVGRIHARAACAACAAEEGMGLAGQSFRTREGRTRVRRCGVPMQDRAGRAATS